jgi:opacity protein-like surface antigen
MKSFLKTSTKLLGVALATATFSAGALAGGGYGAKDGMGGIPVPAPIPVADHAPDYYFRVDAAYGWSDASRFGTSYSHPNAGYADALRWDEGFSEFGRYGLGIGKYFNSYFRGDITFDMRNEHGGDTATTELITPGAGMLWSQVIADNIRTNNSTMMVNGYVDVPVSTRIRPYIGAGVGFAVHRLRRSFSNTVTCDFLDPLLTDCNLTQPGDQGQGTQIANVTGEDKDWSFGFAGALMAGAVVDISSNWKLDVGYRFLHLTSVDFTNRLQGTVDGTAANLAGTVRIPDQNIHELRVGLRYDIH